LSDSRFNHRHPSQFKEDTGEPSVSVQEFNPIACTANRPNTRGGEQASALCPRGERTLARVHRGQWLTHSATWTDWAAGKASGL